MMKKKRISKLLTVVLGLVLLLSDASMLLPAGGVQPAQAGFPGPNVIISFFRAFGALSRRNQVYREAGATSAEMNAYYDTLIAQAGETRRAMISRAAAGEEVSPLMARAYIRIEAALEAERRAAIAMIEVEKNQARKDFEKTIGKEIVNILLASPGGQRIIGQVRDTLGGAMDAAEAVQQAVESGSPIGALQEALVKKVGDFPLAQAAARRVGSMVGHGLDRALGGALTKVEVAINNIHGGMGEALEVMETLDSEVAKHDKREKQPVSLVENNSPLGKIFPVDRANAVADVAASAYAGAVKIAGALEPGTSRGDMKDRIRDSLLDDRVQGIRDTVSSHGVGQYYCIGVGRGPYEVAAKQLGQTPETPADPERAVYKVCYINQTQTPVLAKMFGGGKKENELAEDEEQPQTPPSAGDEIPVGTYVGTTDYPQTLATYFDPGQYTVNNVIIHVAEDGTVSGSYSIYLVGNHETEEYLGKDCTGHAEAAFDGAFHGQLTGSHGTISSSEMWACEYLYDCDIMDVCSTDEPFYRQFDIQVNGDHMKGSTLPPPEAPEGWLMWTFDATKE